MHNKHQSVQIMEAAQSLMNLFNGGSTSTVSPVVAHGINAAPYLADFVADDDDDEVVAVAATGGTATAEPACGASSSMSSTSSTTPDSPPETRR